MTDRLAGGNNRMGVLVGRFLLLAADAPKTGAPPAGGAEGGTSGILGFMAPLFLIAIIFYFLLVRPQKREREKQDGLLKGLKKNDRVVTIGGIVGTIVNIEPDSKVVTLKIDDNTRMIFLRSAIQGPFADAKDEPSLKENKA
jgi:preprotein translocase subunit YajC